MGYIVLEPDEGHLACGTSGKGRLPEPARLADFMLNLSPQDLRGLKVLVTAGPTQEGTGSGALSHQSLQRQDGLCYS